MTRNELVKQLAEISTRPIGITATADATTAEPASTRVNGEAPTELFVWFEDTAARALEGRRGVAGLPESLLPISREMKLVERRYAANHLHLLSAVRISCRQNAAELIASLYTAALSVGTVAWIGTGQAIRSYVERHVPGYGSEIADGPKRKAPHGAFFYFPLALSSGFVWRRSARPRRGVELVHVPLQHARG